MGRVFSWPEIIEKRVPNSADFLAVREEIENVLTATNAITAVLVYGSTLRPEEMTMRSDLDCIAVYDLQQREIANRSFAHLESYAAEHHVPLGLEVIDHYTLTTPLHHLDPLFIVHLLSAITHGGTIKGNIIDLIGFNMDPTEALRSYLRFKLRKFDQGEKRLEVMRRAWLGSETREYLNFLEEILTTPTHVARKILWYFNMGASLPSDSKTSIRAVYPKIAEADECVLFTKLTSMDDVYTAELKQQIKSPDFGSYMRSLKRIEPLARDAFEFTRLNAMRIAT